MTNWCGIGAECGKQHSGSGFITTDGSMISIDTIAVENEVADNMYERSELDWLIFNAPVEYADLVLNGDPVKYLKTVTVYKPFEN